MFLRLFLRKGVSSVKVSNPTEFSLAVISEIFALNRQAEWYSDLVDYLEHHDGQLDAVEFARILLYNIGSEESLAEDIRNVWEERKREWLQ